MIFFTADLHFWHATLAKRRGFRSVEHMNGELIGNWNRKVAPEDTVYVLGDLSFAGREKTVEVMSWLNGHIKIVPGNHDNDKVLRSLAFMDVEILEPLAYIKPEGLRINLCHFPITSWRSMGLGAWMLHGHCHGSLDMRWTHGKQLDVGVDVPYTNFAPVSLELLREKMMPHFPFNQVDHHKERIT